MNNRKHARKQWRKHRRRALSLLRRGRRYRYDMSDAAVLSFRRALDRAERRMNWWNDTYWRCGVVRTAKEN